MALAVVRIPEEVSNAFAEARTGDHVRFLRLSIDITTDENTPTLVLEHTQNGTQSFSTDFDSLANQIQDANKPYFFTVRLEDPSEWVLVWYVPDSSKVRQKMLFSSAVNHLKNSLGNQYLISDYHTTAVSELSHREFLRGWTHPSKRSEVNPDLMTEKEKIDAEERSSGHVHFSGPTKVGVHGLDLPATEQAQNRLQQFANGSVSHVGLTIDSERELISLITEQDATTVDELKNFVSATEPSYHLFSFQKQVFFVYACPTQSKVKQRMIYSATKSSIVGYVASLGINVDRSVEVSDPEDLTEDTLLPQDTSALNQIQKVTKPKRPGRGAARVSKATDSNDN